MPQVYKRTHPWNFPVSSPAAQLARRRNTLFAFFLLPGALLAAWITRTPAIRDALGASLAEMGLVLAGLSVGSMTGLLASGPLIARFGTRPVTQLGMVLIISSMFTLALATVLQVLPLASVALLLFGLGMGGAELAINMEGAEVERISGKIVLPTLHGCFSVGTVIGALTSLLLIKLQVPVVWHLLAMGVLGALAISPFINGLAPGFGRTDKHAKATADDAPRPRLWREPALLMIAAITLSMTLSEGSAYDWLPLLMADAYATGEMTGTLVFLGFATTMAIGRLGSGVLLQRMDRRSVLVASMLMAAAGMAVVVTSQHLLLVVAGVVFWGLGASVAFPLALSAAAVSGDDSNARVKLVATGGYLALLVGPPMLGFVANAVGLRGAFAVVLALVLLALLATPAVPRSRPGQQPAAH